MVVSLSNRTCRTQLRVRIFRPFLIAFGRPQDGILQLFIGKWLDDNIVATDIEHPRPHLEAWIARVDQNRGTWVQPRQHTPKLPPVGVRKISRKKYDLK